MRIAQVVCTYPPYKGGIGTSARDFSDALLELGHEAVVFTPLYKEFRNTLFTMDGGSVMRLKPLLEHGNAAFIPGLFGELKGFDLVILHYPFFGAAEITALSKVLRRGQKLAIFYHMDVKGLPPFASIMRIPSDLLSGWVFRRADAVICSSLDYMKESGIKKLYGSDPGKFIEIPFAVDISLYHPAESGASNSGGSVLFVGGLDKAHYFKGVDVLIRAFAGVSAEIRNGWRLDIVGKGSLVAEYRTLSEECGIGSVVHFHEDIEDAAKIEMYRKADIFVLPSINTNEAFGIVLLEAMASGLPVIATRLPGVRSVFEEGVQGLYCAPGSTEDLKGNLSELMKDGARRKSMGIKARELTVSSYSRSVFVNRLNSALNKIRASHK